MSFVAFVVLTTKLYADNKTLLKTSSDSIDFADFIYYDHTNHTQKLRNKINK